MSHPENNSPVTLGGDHGQKPQVTIIDGVPTLSPPGDPDHADKAAHIRRLLGKLAADTREIGETLLAVKAALKLTGEKGAFGAWMDRHFGWTPRQGQRFMKVAEFCQRYPEADSLPASVICLLASNTTPTEILSAILVEKRLGARPTRQAVKALIDQSQTGNLFSEAAMGKAPYDDQDPAAVHAAAQDTAEMILAYLPHQRALHAYLARTDGNALIQALREELAERLGEDEGAMAA
jgi:hypothetical protein